MKQNTSMCVFDSSSVGINKYIRVVFKEKLGVNKIISSVNLQGRSYYYAWHSFFFKLIFNFFLLGEKVFQNCSGKKFVHKT